MATFDPNNPFNIRGVLIEPANANGGPPQSHLYAIVLDVLASEYDDNLGGCFTFTNPHEQGNTMTYTFNDFPLGVPTEGSSVRTVLLPLYINQNIDQPNEGQNNLHVQLSINGVPYQGNPNSRRPPVFDVIDNLNPIQWFRMTSNSDGQFKCTGILANSGEYAASYSATLGDVNDLTVDFYFSYSESSGITNIDALAWYVGEFVNYTQVTLFAPTDAQIGTYPVPYSQPNAPLLFDL